MSESRAPKEQEAQEALARVPPDKFTLANEDKRHKREVEVQMRYLEKYYEDRNAERAQKRFLTIAALVAVGAAFAATLIVGKYDLAERILTAVLPTGAYALGSQKRSDQPQKQPTE